MTVADIFTTNGIKLTFKNKTAKFSILDQFLKLYSLLASV